MVAAERKSWSEPKSGVQPVGSAWSYALDARAHAGSSPTAIARLVREGAEPIEDIESCDLRSTIERIGTSRLVLIGEATHGTSEFYRMRARLTRELVEEHGFTIVAVEADWPDASVVNRWAQALPRAHLSPGEAFQRFPTWMWRNREVTDFLGWMHAYNGSHRGPKVGFYGLDLYSLFTSIRAVLDLLDRSDPEVASVARQRYGCLEPWQGMPELYGRAATMGRYRRCETEAISVLRDLLTRRLMEASLDGPSWLDAVENARLVADAERYYRAMYRGATESWNLRDQHMFTTLEAILAHHGPTSRAVIWEHNSHLGDASATERSSFGELNIGQLCRERFPSSTYIVGFGTDHGTVRAAPSWDEPDVAMDVRPAHAASYERIFHQSGVAAFRLPLRSAPHALRRELASPRLSRAIGVVYRPETELASHYFGSCLPLQFDEYVWFDESTAVTPISRLEASLLAPDHPFGTG